MLRTRKNRRYNEEANDEEGDGERKFDLVEQIKSKRYEQVSDKYLLELPGEAITLKLIQKNGLDKPILVKDPTGLELIVPPKSFRIRDVRDSVGQQRVIDVMDVKTQKNIEMTMKDWCKYYESKHRDKLLNVISLEFSHTTLDELVESPRIVKQLDWVDLVWPKFLKESQTESTNNINQMKYPKVQKYCLMSVKGSYTDFHIDFGGTSVWYHILRGKKIFWMVPPTELNFQTFEEWTLSGQQQQVFFGDTVEECFRVELKAGDTFFIPSGWIHAVYTLEDSLVFGGNFLHSYGIENQLKVAKIEDSTKVPVKFRYPFYTEILWYVVQHYVHCLTGKDHLHRPEKIVAQKEKSEIENNIKSNSIEIEGETTESEQEDSDNAATTRSKKSTKKKGAQQAKKRNNNKRNKAAPRRSTPKRQAKKRATTYNDEDSEADDDEDEDGESTEIDSASEEPSKPAPSATCRMTKNSLLRLQYEIEEQSPNKSAKQVAKSDCASKVKKKSEFTPQQNKPLAPQQQQSSTINTSNLSDILSNESKLNGWSSGGQSTWSHPNTECDGPRRINLTKFECNGLKALVKYLSKLSGAKKHLPALIRNSRALLDDCRKMLAEHEDDDPELAVTGIPITLELLNTKKADINELIGQFFKPQTETKEGTELSPPSKDNKLSHQRLKSGVTNAGDERKSDNNSNLNNSVSPTKFAQKETKCLSPKKLSSQSVSSTSTSPPPRPKSPPTRPLSNNQYTSKTKNNNNILLPGSFADLIAATSTEKKVFDVGGVDIASSLFSAKDTSSNKSTGQPAKCSKTSITEKIDPLLDLTASSAISAGSSSGASNEQSKLSSPEPPKPAQKRFINPNYRPANREKLIYASAPYVNPVYADQSRSGPYPWQTPSQAPLSPQANNQRMSNPNYPPHPPAPAPSCSQSTYNPEAQNSNSSNLKINTKIASSPTRVSNHQLDKQPHQGSTPPDSKVHNIAVNVESPAEGSRPSERFSNYQSVGGPDIKLKVPEIRSTAFESRTPATIHGPLRDAKCVPLTAEKKQSTIGESAAPSVIHSVVTTAKDEESKVKKQPAKPRGPPKKSKEAREVIGTQVSEDRRTSISVSQPISLNPLVVPSISSLPKTSKVSDPASTPTQPAEPKPKANKKSKKSQKDKTAPVSDNSSVKISSAPVPVSMSAAALSQQASIFCGLVAPPVSSGASSAVPKVGPQPYLISRPLLFNPMPQYSTAQYPQLSHAPMPLFTAPMSSPLGLPLQQGARIVWATPPRPLNTNGSVPNNNLVASQAAAAAALAKNQLVGLPHHQQQTLPLQPPTSAHNDNAALLSLATTALSTAPMVSSPALSQLSNRTATPQAIMVNSAISAAAAGQTTPSSSAAAVAAAAALFSPNAAAAAASQAAFLRPYVQRMPTMTSPFVAAHPGGARPPGQLVFARLPHTSHPGQQPPRYLITQPRFVPPRFPLLPTLATGQPTPNLAYATFKPSPPTTTQDPTKGMRSKKVKTS